MKDNIKCKSVFSPGIARKLIQSGCHLVDIKPSKENHDKTIFIFEETQEFLERLSDCIKQRKSCAEKMSDVGIELGIVS